MSDWTDFNDEAPPANTPVLVHMLTPIWKNSVMIVCLNYDGKELRALEGGKPVKTATHWMRLPDAP